MVENGSYKQFSWGKSSFEKLIALWRHNFFVAKQLNSMGGMPHVLNVWIYECCSEVDSTIAEILKKAGLITDASTSHSTKKQKTVRFDSTTAEEQVCQKTSSFISTRTVPTQKIASSDSKHVHAEKTIPSSSLKSVCQDNSDEKWDDIKLFLQSYVSSFISNSQLSSAFDMPDVEECSEDNATAILDALLESIVNHNSDNTNVGTSTIVHVHNDHMCYVFKDVEGVSADFGLAILKCIVATIENQKPDNDNVGTSNMQVNYSSTLPESAQVELDAILKVIAASVDDVPIEVVPPVEPIVNQHDIFDSQFSLNFPDVVVAAHQAAKTPAKIVKRIRTRSKIFKSPYTTEYASGSKAIEDQIEEQKQQLAFDGFLISDTMSSSVIEEFKQWVEENFPWHQVDEVYVPINCNENFHWVLAVIALKDRRIRVYDSLSRRRNTKSITEIQKLAKMLPTYLSDSKFYDEISRTDWPNLETYRDKITQMAQILNEHPFDVEYVQHIMQQECDTVDCGVFVVGYAEYLSEEMNVPSDDFEAEYHRMRYATLLRKYGI
ncbi:hypothetical protein CQW23_28697 [Capsicum baccatum]|uniref:Ubiquitin-like protease family profile domain-containing protein n=1 Tax=Capsicum baccatum TaxID=33114 RepID=A0A2G2VH94_CAPBA|nr:hypothetical protein CQW23_28697 [Capsicum baccatum]